MPLSVVIPTYQTRELTLRCVGSLQDAPEGSEVIVVDDGSTDGTLEALRARFPDAIHERLEKRSGFTVAVNRGLARSTADVLLLLNSDTEVEPGSLAAVLDTMAAKPELGAVGAQLLNLDGSYQWSGGGEPTLGWLFVLAAKLGPALARLPGYRTARPLGGVATLRHVDWVTGAAMALRRQAWESTGCLDESYGFYAQDLDYCCRLRAAGWQVAIEPRFRVRHCGGATVRSIPGAVGGRDLAQLFSDLLWWGRRHRSRRWLALAAGSLWLGSYWRLGVDRFGAILGRSRQGGRAETAAVREAVAVLARRRREWSRAIDPTLTD